MIREITLDDGGMNLLSSDALRRLREQLRVASCELRAEGHAQLATTELLMLRLSRAAGADMNEMRRFTATDAEEFSRLGQETFDAIERLPFLTAVAIDGDCF